jgi:hypothetical protein
MSIYPISVRALLLVTVLLSIALGSVAPPAAAQDPASEFQELVQATNEQVPIFGPAAGDLPYEGFSDCPDCTWAAGVSATDLRVHLDLAWPVGDGLAGTLFIAIRQTDPNALDLGQPNFFTVTRTTWMAGDRSGDLATLPTSIDVGAVGDRGYLGIDGTLMASTDLSVFSGPGDVVLSGAVFALEASPPLGISNFSVWDLGGLETSTTSETSVTTDAEETYITYSLAALTQPAIYGPGAGTMVHDPDRVTFQDAEVSVSDFSAHVTCTAPPTVGAGFWDCGLAFRNLQSAEHYRLEVISDGTWFLAIAGDSTVQEGSLGPPIDVSRGEISLHLIVRGTTGYFAVNDVFVSSLDVSAFPGPGTVAAATSFFQETFVENGSTGYRDFTVFSLDSVSEPDSSGVGQLPVDLTQVPGLMGNTYTDPAFGYALTWQSDWSVVDYFEVRDAQILRISNGPITADIYGYATTSDPAGCLDELLAAYRSNPTFSDVRYAVDQQGEPMLSVGTDTAIGIVSLTYLDAQGVTQTIYDYALCATRCRGGKHKFGSSSMWSPTCSPRISRR